MNKNLIQQKVRKFLIENMMDYYEEYGNLSYEIFMDIKNKEKIQFFKIPKNIYHKALKEFMEYGTFVRFPEKYVLDWRNLVVRNVFLLEALTNIYGHSSGFPYDEFYDVFDDDGEFTKWVELKNNEGENYSVKYDFYSCYDYLEEVCNIDDYVGTFSNGQPLLSDFGLKPLMKIVEKMSETDDPDKLIVLINQLLDVTHQRSDLAELFIQGGSESLTYISNS